MSPSSMSSALLGTPRRPPGALSTLPVSLQVGLSVVPHLPSCPFIPVPAFGPAFLLCLCISPGAFSQCCLFSFIDLILILQLSFCLFIDVTVSLFLLI